MFMLLLLKEKKVGKMITGISGFGFFFVSRFVTHLSFSKNALLKPLFIVFFLCAFFGQCVKKGILDAHQKKKNLIDHWKALSLVFLCFFCFCVFCFLFLIFLLLVFLFFLDQVWPPHLALNPPYFWVCFVFPLLFKEKIRFPQEKDIFCLFWSVSVCFSLAFFGLPFFNFSFSVYLLSFLSSFLSFLFVLFWFLVLVSFFFFFSVFFASVSWKEQHQNIQLHSFFINRFSFGGLLSCFFFDIPFSYLCFFLILSCVFCSTSMFLVKKKHKFKNTNFGSRGGVQQNGVFLNEPVLCKMCKVIVFLPFWGGQILVDAQKPL